MKINDMEMRDLAHKKNIIGSYSVYFLKLSSIMAKYIEQVKEELDTEGHTTYDIMQRRGDIRTEELSEEARNCIDKDNLYKEVVSRREEVAETISDAFEVDSDRHTLVREPMLRSAILPYVEDAVMAAIGKGLAPHLWNIAVEYGLSEARFRSGDGWVYENKEELSEEDKDALRLTAEETYANALYFLEDRNMKFLSDFISFNTPKFTPYPMGGMSEEEVGKVVGEKWVSTVASTEEGELLYTIPFVVSRIDEAVYYSIAYSGDEYLRYISTLSVEDDWDTVNGKRYGNYESILNTIKTR